MTVQRRPKTGTDKNGRVRWVARYRDLGGREHSKTFSTKRDAESYLTEQLHQLDRRTWTAPEKRDQTVSDYCSTWIELHQASATTIASYQQTIKKIDSSVLGSLPVGTVKATDIKIFYADLLDSGLSASTVAAHIVRTRTIFQSAVDDDILVKNPVIHGISRAAKRTNKMSEFVLPTQEEITNIINTLENGYEDKTGVRRRGNPRIAAMVKIATATGMRVSEIAGLSVDDIDFEEGVIKVRAQGSQNGIGVVPLKSAHSKRDIPISDGLVITLREVIEDRDEDREDGALFTTQQGRMYSASTLGATLKRAVAKSGSRKEITWHSFRHYFASQLIQNGTPIPVVQKLLGHATADITLRVYSHVLESYKKDSETAVGSLEIPYA